MGFWTDHSGEVRVQAERDASLPKRWVAAPTPSLIQCPLVVVSNVLSGRDLPTKVLILISMMMINNHHRVETNSESLSILAGRVPATIQRTATLMVMVVISSDDNSDLTE